MRVLIVDDDLVSRLLLRKILERDGTYEVTEAGDGQEAWEILQKGERPDLAIFDLMMPRMNGLDLLQRIRGDSRLRSVRVMICTVLGDRGSIERAASLEISAYLLKPFNATKLLEEVQRIFSGMGAAEALHDPAGTRRRLGIELPFFIHLLKILVGEVDKGLTQIFRANTEEEERVVSMTINALKGSSKNLGAVSLMNALGGVEVALIGEQHLDLSKRLEVLAVENKRLKATIQKLERSCEDAPSTPSPQQRPQRAPFNSMQRPRRPMPIPGSGSAPGSAPDPGLPPGGRPAAVQAPLQPSNVQAEAGPHSGE